MKFSKAFALLLIACGFLGLYLLRDLAPLVRLIAASLGMIGVIKVVALIWQISDGAKFRSRLGIFLFLFAWPGVSVSGFTERTGIVAATGARFLEAWLTFLAGFRKAFG